jgi:hypothetical protein
MWYVIIIGASVLAGIGLGIALARLTRKAILLATWLALFVLAGMLWAWSDAQPGLEGLGAAAAVLLVILPLFVGSLVSGLIVWVRHGNVSDDR